MQVLDTDQKSISYFFLKDFLNEEARDNLNKIKVIEQEIDKDDLIYKTRNKKEHKTHAFQKLKTI